MSRPGDQLRTVSADDVFALETVEMRALLAKLRAIARRELADRSLTPYEALLLHRRIARAAAGRAADKPTAEGAK